MDVADAAVISSIPARPTTSLRVIAALSFLIMMDLKNHPIIVRFGDPMLPELRLGRF
jgi:hypothetical protein